MKSKDGLWLLYLGNETVKRITRLGDLDERATTVAPSVFITLFILERSRKGLEI